MAEPAGQRTVDSRTLFCVFINSEWYALIVKHSNHRARKTSPAHVLAFSVSFSRENQHEQTGVYFFKHLAKHLFVISV